MKKLIKPGTPMRHIKYLVISLFLMPFFTLVGMQPTPKLVREQIKTLETEVLQETSPERIRHIQNILALRRQELQQLQAQQAQESTEKALRKELEQAQLAAQQLAEKLRQLKGTGGIPTLPAQVHPEKETFTLLLENHNTEPIYVAIAGRKAPEGYVAGPLSYVTSYVYTDDFLVQPQEIKGSESLTLTLPKESDVYQRWICWDTKPFEITTCSHLENLDTTVTDNEKIISLITPERKLELKKEQAALLRAQAPPKESVSLRIHNQNRDPIYIALVGRTAPEGYVAGPLSYVTSYVYTDELLTEPQEIKGIDTLTLVVPKEAEEYQRWICWDTKPFESSACSNTVALDKHVKEDEKTIEIMTPERQQEREEELFEEKIAHVQSQIALLPHATTGKGEVAEDTYLLKIKNKDIKPLQVALVGGFAPTSGISAYVPLTSYFFTLKPLTKSLEIEPMGKLIVSVPKEVASEALWLFWDDKPIACTNNVCNGTHTDLGTVVKEDRKTVKILTEERRRYLNNAAQMLIRERNTEPKAQIEATASSGSNALPADESTALEKRNLKTKKSIQAITGLTDLKEVPNGGLCLSGGGLRAMFSSIGLAQGLKNEGLIDIFNYTAGLSGSTWFLMKWLEQGGSPEKLDAIAQELRESMAKGLVPKQLLDPVTKELSKWTAFKELAVGGTLELDPDFNAQFKASLICPDGKCNNASPSMIDLWGYFLGRRLFKGKEDQYQFTLSSLKEAALLAEMPLPIFTAVDSKDTKGYIDSITKWAWSNRDQEPPKDYKWFEVSPFSASLRRGNSVCDIPVWGLGRKYKSGWGGWSTMKSVKEPSYNFEPFLSTKPKEGQPTKEVVDFYRIEPSASQLLGAFGSAFTVSLGEVAKMKEELLGGATEKLKWAALGAQALSTALPQLAPVAPTLTQLSGVVQHVSKNLVTSDKDQQFFDGFGLYDFYKGGEKKLELRDAGVFYNLPLPALFDARRNLDIILIHDTSGDLHEVAQDGTPFIGSELAKFRQYPEFAGKKIPHELSDENHFRTKMNAIYTKKKMMAVFNDPRQENYNPDEITLIYVPTVSHPGVEALKINPTEKFGTFKLQYDTSESEQLMNYSKALAEHIAPEIKEILTAKTKKMNR